MAKSGPVPLVTAAGDLNEPSGTDHPKEESSTRDEADGTATATLLAAADTNETSAATVEESQPPDDVNAASAPTYVQYAIDPKTNSPIQVVAKVMHTSVTSQYFTECLGAIPCPPRKPFGRAWRWGWR